MYGTPSGMSMITVLELVRKIEIFIRGKLLRNVWFVVCWGVFGGG